MCPWTNKELARLEFMVSQGYVFADICTNLSKHSVSAVRQRIHECGFKLVPQHRWWKLAHLYWQERERGVLRPQIRMNGWT